MLRLLGILALGNMVLGNNRDRRGSFPVSLFLLPALMFGGWISVAVVGSVLGLIGSVIGGVFSGLVSLASGAFSGSGLVVGIVIGLEFALDRTTWNKVLIYVLMMITVGIPAGLGLKLLSSEKEN